MPARTKRSKLVRAVGRRIAELRRAKDWTQEQFAAEAEVLIGYVRRVEGGYENLSLESLEKFATLLGVDVVELLKPPAATETRPGRPRRTQP
jgi:transcriptional regulator with XRE-family HTH domain